MAFNTGSNKGPMADINVTPLVDVMLVLLIIFIVTAPIMTYPIAVDLPQKVTIPPPPQLREPPPPIDLRIDALNQVYWDDNPVPLYALQAQMEEEVQRDPSNQPELHVDAHPDSEYETLARVMAQAKNAQMTKIRFTKTIAR